jgi:hypothetical protein
LLHATEEFLVFEFVVGETDQCLHRVLVVERMRTALVQHLGADEAFDEAEDVGIGAALDLAQEPGVLCREERDRVHAREARGEEVAGEVELAVLQQVAVDLPFGLLRDAHHLRVAGGAGLFGGCEDGVHRGLRY